MNNGIFEIIKSEQDIIYKKMVIKLFKSLYKDSKISNTEYELLVSEVNRTFNLS